MNKAKSADKLVCADGMMLKLAAYLVQDFQTCLKDDGFCSNLLPKLWKGDIPAIREALPAADPNTSDSYRFKCEYQIQGLLKRYRFVNDLYSDKELTQKAIDGFMSTQSRLAAIDLDTLPSYMQNVLSVAADYVAEVLGPYDDEAIRSLCRFGRKASVGVPARDACEAARWQIPISGSLEQINWFDSEMNQIESVQNYLNAQKADDPSRSTYQEIDSLALTLVPKTFKSLRSIMPNTTIGSYWSYGVGEMMRLRLKRKGYDITTLQQRHRYLARTASVHNLYVTADLSSASDCITVALVRRLLPSDWAEALLKSRISKVRLPDGQVVESITFATMGIGYTFPLQSLIFLALLKAIERILYHPRDRRTISVYGDDMIYSSRQHRQVVHVFEKLGFIINVDKTFSDGPFRESCGGDYHYGVDVRPFQPRNGSATVGLRAYEAMLYKMINGLLNRWSEHEIETALSFLVSELIRVTGKPKLVPSHYPDDSGIKVSSASPQGFLAKIQCARPKHVGHGVFRFAYLSFKPELREERRHEPYYWLSIGRPPRYHTWYLGDPAWDSEASATQGLINEVTGVRDSREPLLKTQELVPIKTFRSKITGCRLRRTATYVTISHTGRYTRQSGLSCFESRR